MSFLSEVLDEHFLCEDEMPVLAGRNGGNNGMKKTTTYSGQSDDKGGIVGTHLDVWILADDLFDS